MKKKSILFLQPTFDSLGPRNIRTSNLIPYLKEKFNFVVLCFEVKEKHRFIDDVEIIRLQMNWINRFFLFKGSVGYMPNKMLVTVNKIITYSLRKLMLFDGFLIEKKKIRRAVINRNFDFVLASIKPESMGVIALHLKKKGIVYKDIIFDIGDPLSFNSANKLCSFREYIYRQVERRMLKKANKIIVTNVHTKKYYSDKLSINQDKIYVIPQGVDVKLIQEDIAPNFKNNISMIYAGTFYPKLRDPQEFIKAVNDVDRENLTIKLYGNSNLTFKVKKTKVIVEERINQELLFREYSKSNLVLYFDNAYGIQTSGKIYEVLSLNKPILFIYTNENSPVYLEHKNNQSIFFVKNSYEKLCECFLNLETILSSMPKNINDKNQYSWSSRADIFINKIFINPK